MAQVVHAAVRVAVERQRTQARAQFGLQISGQAVRVLHGVELDHAFGILDGVGVHGLHVLADAAGNQRGNKGIQIGHVTLSKTLSGVVNGLIT